VREITKEERMQYCLARAEGARLFEKDEKQAEEWIKRLEEEKKGGDEGC